MGTLGARGFSMLARKTRVKNIDREGSEKNLWCQVRFLRSRRANQDTGMAVLVKKLDANFDWLKYLKPI